ncbi:MAG: eukaryotic-like serine/threonine-protein kinase [Acidobacteriota bacterium]|jgi:serine/threonine protein kinase|nr:eukaryotic-like serine/threonine-protein kinase [Acidobacteriota bacterium]
MESGKKVGSYIVEEQIGRGGMGVVYRGRHEKLLRVVAIKSINPRGTHDLRRLRHRFEREAYVQAQLDHPGVVKIYDYIVSEQTYFIVMEYVDGRSLAQLIAEHPEGLPVERALDLFEQILEAISYAHNFVYRDEQGAEHRGIVHRDLKPPNIMVTDGDRIKVTDFGIVKLVGASATDTSKIAYGSPRYVSPEQAAGEELDQRSDIYSLGVILYEMLTGEPPFGGRAGSKEGWARTEILRAHREQPPRPPSELNHAVTPAVERVVLRALEKKPERRFASAADFLRAVRKARGHESHAISPEHVSVPPESAEKGTGLLGEPTEELAHDPYHTQPLASETCGVCGAGFESGELVCRECGHDLTSSPATAELARQEITSRQGRQGLKLFGLSVALLLLLASLVYFVRSFDVSTSKQSDEPPASNAAPTPSASDTTAPETPPTGAGVAALDADVNVDSSFDGYNKGPLTDGVTDVREIKAKRYNQGNWVSAESPVEHWIELGFRRPTRVTAVYVYWGFDRDRYMPSRQVELQAPDGAGGWRTVSTLEPGENFDRTAFEFHSFVAERVRLFQPAQAGPHNRPFVMWVREVQAFGSQDAATKAGE